jgi:cell division protein FtsQ
MLLYFILIPGFAPIKIRFEGTRLYNNGDLALLITPKNGTSWISFNTASACAKLSSLTGIESVTVEKKFPDKIVVNITERVPVAITLATQNGRTVAVLLDKTGAVFVPQFAPPQDSLPLITGLPLEQIGPGMRLSKVYHPLLEQIGRLILLPQKYFSAFSEIRVIPKEYGGYELIVYPIKSRVRILLDRGLNEDTLKTMMVTLDVVSSMEPNVEQIDLRYGSFSYRVKSRGAEVRY